MLAEGFWEVDGHAVSPLDLSRTLPVGGGSLVPYSLSGSPVIKQLGKWLLWCLARVGGFNQCASPNREGERKGNPPTLLVGM